MTLSEITGTKPLDIVGSICLFGEEKKKPFIEASDLWNEFENADIVERGKMLGIDIEVVK